MKECSKLCPTLDHHCPGPSTAKLLQLQALKTLLATRAWAKTGMEESVHSHGAITYSVCTWLAGDTHFQDPSTANWSLKATP